MLLDEGTSYFSGETFDDNGLVFEGTGAEMLMVVNEGAEEFFNMQKALMRVEHKAVISENAALLQEGFKESLLKFKDWIVEKIKKVVAWIKQLISDFTGFIANDAKFVQKFGAQLKKGNYSKWVSTGDMYRRYNFKSINNLAQINNRLEPFDTNLASYEGKTKDELFKAHYKGLTSISDCLDDANDALYIGGKDAKGALKGADLDIPEMLACIENNKDIIAALKKAQGSCQKMGNDALKLMDAAAKDANTAVDKGTGTDAEKGAAKTSNSKAASVATEFVRSVVSCDLTLLASVIDTTKAAKNQARSVCAALVRYEHGGKAEKDNNKSESGSILDSYTW